MMPELIIFDNDGVLIDSEILWHQQCSKYFQQQGINISVMDSIRYFCFQDQNKLAKHISEEYLAKIRELTELSYHQKLRAIGGISELLLSLKEKNIPICVASNADLNYINETLT